MLLLLFYTKNYNSNDTRMFRSKRSREDEEKTNSVGLTSRESPNNQMVALSTATALGLSI